MINYDFWKTFYLLSFSSNLDFSLIKRLERDFFTLSECISNVLIIQENLILMKKKWATGQVAFVKKLLLTELGLYLHFCWSPFNHWKYLRCLFIYSDVWFSSYVWKYFIVRGMPWGCNDAFKITFAVFQQKSLAVVKVA